MNMKRRKEAVIIILVYHVINCSKMKPKKKFIPSGYTELDRITGGWQSGDLVVIAAPPGMGKTAFMLSIAQNITKDYGYSVALFSLEMSKRQLWKRMILSEHDMPKFIIDTPAISVWEVWAYCRNLAKGQKTNIAFIDYLQLMTDANQEQEIPMVLEQLKAMAKNCNIPVIVFSQLSRNMYDRNTRPQLKDLPEMQIIANHADIMAFIHRPELYLPSTEDEQVNSFLEVAEIIIAKNWKNKPGIVQLIFDKKLAKFLEKPKEQTDKQDKQVDDWQRMRNKYAAYTVKQLEEVIADYWHVEKKKVTEKLKDYMAIRYMKLNETFKWTPENIERFLYINQKIINCFEKIRNEAKCLCNTLQKRIDEKDDFLHDFYIEANVIPYIHVADENGTLCEAENGIERILTDMIDEDTELCTHWIRDEDDANRMIYLRKDMLNWSDSPVFEGKFNECFISQAMHELYDHSYWSFPDILKINHLQTVFDVVCKNYEKI